MKLAHTLVRIVSVGLLAAALAGCATAGDRRSNNTLIGAGLGAATGAVFSQGDPLYTIGGAAAGGLLGNLLTPDRSYRRGWNGPPRRGHVNQRNYSKHHYQHSKHGRGHQNRSNRRR